MRILIVSYEYPPLGGGGGVVVAHLARAWVRLGHRVVVLTSGAADLPPLADDAGVEVHRVPVPGRTARATASLLSLLAFPLSAWWYARRWQPDAFDVIKSFFAVPSGLAGAGLAWRWRLPHAVAVMGGDIFDPSKRFSPHRTPGLKQVVRLVLQRADCIVAESQDIHERARHIYGVQTPIQIVPHGLELPPAAPTPHPPTPVTLITVARLVRRKRLDLLLQAFATLTPAARLVLLGDGPERARLAALSQSLGVADRVEFRGYVTEAAKLAALRAADVFVLVSEHEGFGLVYLEAAAQQLPVVAATVGGQVDFLVHGHTGWLVAPGDVRQLAQALATLITQPALRQWMGANAAAMAARYHIDPIAATYLQVLHDLIPRHD